MGVPGLFLWLLKKYDLENLITNKESINSIDSLLIDTNCLLHPQCFSILNEHNNLDIINLELKMIKKCINYIDYLITFINPKKIVYISIDGVAPFAKIKQQRMRRFKSAHDRRKFKFEAQFAKWKKPDSGVIKAIVQVQASDIK